MRAQWALLLDSRVPTAANNTCPDASSNTRYALPRRGRREVKESSPRLPTPSKGTWDCSLRLRRHFPKRWRSAR
eukprot:4403189-Pyramimonas_sp.AAC.1